jgi:hypothetical protein
MAKTTLTPSEMANQAGREFEVPVDGFQATIAAASVAGMLASRKLKLKAVQAKCGVCGSAGQTDVQAHVNGTLVPGATVTIDNADADGTIKTAGPSSETIINPGDTVEIVVSAAPTGGQDGAYKIVCVEVYD